MELKDYIREARGITIGEAAEELGITRQYLNMIATGKVIPGRNTAIRIERWSAKVVKAVELLRLAA